MSYPIISDNKAVQAFYEQCRSEGTSHLLAEMFATRSAPRANSDRELFEGQGTLLDQFGGDERDLGVVLEGAKKHGYKVNINDYYCPSLVHPDIGPGDPAAFVPATGGRGHIKKVCEARGWDCHGAVNVRAHRKDSPDVDVPLAENIVRAEAKKMIAKDAKLGKASRKEITQEVYAKHAPKW